MSALRRGVLAFALLTACHAAAAFGPKTHLWIAGQVLADLRNGCSVRLAAANALLGGVSALATMCSRNSAVDQPSLTPECVVLWPETMSG